MAQLGETGDVVSPQVELGQVLAAGEVLQGGDFIGTVKRNAVCSRTVHIIDVPEG